MLSDYRAVIRLWNEMDIIERFASERTTELRDMQTEDETEMKFKPKDYFGGEFLETVDRYLMEVLMNCKYEGLLTAQFLLETFDVAINGKRKATTSGKGYRAIFEYYTRTCHKEIPRREWRIHTRTAFGGFSNPAFKAGG